MRYYLDAEFLEDGKTIELISIGIVAEDGREYYAETLSSPVLATSTEWLRQNVAPHLLGFDLKSHRAIAEEIIAFVGENPEFWAYYADYDWVVLCQLYGRMIDLPEGWPMYCKDLIQTWTDKGFTQHPKDAVPVLGTEHNALADAAWDKALHDYILMKERYGKR